MVDGVEHKRTWACVRDTLAGIRPLLSFPQLLWLAAGAPSFRVKLAWAIPRSFHHNIHPGRVLHHIASQKPFSYIRPVRTSLICTIPSPSAMSVEEGATPHAQRVLT
jgi:hypothetical protein